MSGATSTRCLFCRLLPATPRNPSIAPRRKFHSTPTTNARRKATFASVRAVDLGPIDRKTTQDAESEANLARRPSDRNDRPTGDIESPQQTQLQPAYRNPRARDTHRVQEALNNATSLFKPYTPREKQLLALKYTPEQLAALEAAESSIDPEDIAAQGRMRDDAMRIDYKDDYSKILPLIDHPVKAPDADIDPGITPLSDEETARRFTDWYEALAQRQQDAAEADTNVTDYQELLQNVRAGLDAGVYPGDGLTPQQRLEKLRRYAQSNEQIDDIAEFERFVSDPNNFFFSPKGKLNSQSSALAAELPRMEDPRIVTENESEDPHVERLMVQSGLSEEVIKKIKCKMLVAHRVVNQTRMGKIQSMYYLTIAGDGLGMLGIGEGKGVEPDEAARKSRLNAIRNMKPIPRYEERTIFGEVEGKVGASVVRLSARPPGFGNRCQHLIFEMARAAGLRDLSARTLRSRNKMNVVKATYEALMSQRMPEEVAIARGRKMVDVRKVYYEGLVN
ncbi:putative 37S ribosomal protein S5 [Elsinoe australis]|uniref:Small ribosomal subunit protein uS5m n=1 Tax=Elsinoe australis TaxID=40998 RepID=A0A4U7ANX7_9PEZI|nr:putative 37S ribosomal protein S5 [Elsinoe australis]